MRILVTGADGQLGSELRFLSKTHPDLSFSFTEVNDLDITNQQQVLDYFKNDSFDFCVNCAAYTAVDKAEEEREICDLINITGSQNIAVACQSVGATLIHISTDFVFDGEQSKPLKESDKTEAVNYYGLSKLKGEEVIRDILKTHYIIRSSWLYSSFGKNFVKNMLALVQTKDELRVIADQIGTPTYARDLANVIIRFIRYNRDFGTYHYSNEGVASWYDFTSAIFEYAYIQTPVIPILSKDYPTPARRPHYSVLDKSKIKSALDLEIPHWRTSLKACLKEL